MDKLLADIEAFLAEQKMAASYFGLKAGRDTTLVARLRKGGRVWPEKAKEVRDFMRTYKPRKSTPHNQN